MPHLVFAGLGIEHVQAVFKAGALALPDNWTCKFVPNHTRRTIHIDDPHAVLAAAAESDESHIIGTSQDRSRAKIAESIRSYFRFRLLPDAILNNLVAAKFANTVQILTPILRQEAAWAEQVKPKASADSLLLPKACFRHGGDMDIWGACESYNDPNSVQDALKVLARFKARHLQKSEEDGHAPAKRQWIDDSDHVFDHRGARHAQPPFPRDWKYSHRIETGLHYDVSHWKGRGVTLTDAANRVGKAASDKHLNLDCHGYLR